MDLAELAQLGEFVGGIAVLATLVYLALQIRQNAAAQERTASYAAGAAIDNSATRWSLFRQMIAEPNTGEVWAKARNDDTLTDVEQVRVRAVLQQLAFSAAATIANWRVTGNADYIAGVASAVAVELEGSDTLRRAWTGMEGELRVFGFDELADDVRALLEGAR